MNNTIKFQQIIKFKNEINGNLECIIDITDLKNIKIINITDKADNYILDNAAHSIYKLIGIYQGSFIKKEHQEFMREKEVLEVPSDWSETISLSNMDLITSLSINNFFDFPNSDDWEHSYFINGEQVQLKQYIDIPDILEKEKKYIVNEISHFDLNDIYQDLQKQEQLIRDKENKLSFSLKGGKNDYF